jgi:hypothetical protein
MRNRVNVVLVDEVQLGTESVPCILINLLSEGST